MYNIKVCKFGGSSVANSNQIKKVFEIINSDKERKIVVVSAPKGVTDLLISIVKKSIVNESYDSEFNKIKEIYYEIGTGLDVTLVCNNLLNELQTRIDFDKTNIKQYEDLIKAWGEYSNAKIISEYFNKADLATVFLTPDDVGLYVTEDFGNAKLLSESYENIKNNMTREEVILFPGFYGKTKNGNYATFSRGGSDLTGSILAAGVNAKVYENWTDQDGIRKADPRIVSCPCKIEEITYKEIRELAYIGFKVFHAEAMIPVMRAGIPINIKNTNNPYEKGTLIVNTRECKTCEPVIGIASRDNFVVFNLEKVLMEQQVGFGRKLLSIFEENGLSFEHAPSGIDSISIILDASQLNPKLTDVLIDKINKTLCPDSLSVEFDKCLISCVGLGLKRTPGIAAKITNALARSDINIEVLNQGASEISLMVGINKNDSTKAVNAIYSEFFKAGD